METVEDYDAATGAMREVTIADAIAQVAGATGLKPADDLEPEEQLVDLEKDPGEMVNLAVEDRHQATLQACRERLRTWCRETADEAASIVP